MGAMGGRETTTAYLHRKGTGGKQGQFWVGSHDLKPLPKGIIFSKGALNTTASLGIVSVERSLGERRVSDLLNTDQLLATFLQLESSRKLGCRAKARR